MKPERLTEIESLCKAALEQEPERRADFFAAACQDDEELRREVTALLKTASAPQNCSALVPIRDLRSLSPGRPSLPE